MLTVTLTAARELRRLVAEHPEDPVVRVTLQDLDEQRLVFRITLEEAVRADDAVLEVDGLTVAVEGQSASRMDGMSLDYDEGEGFRFRHPEPPEALDLKVFNLN